VSIYVDTSFLVSLYTLDSNSAAAAKFMKSAALPLWFTPLGEVEMLNALHLRVFRKELDLAEIKSAAALFRADTAAGVFALKALPIAAFERAGKNFRARHAYD
jgi:predicted nucleic acid-binding protein